MKHSPIPWAEPIFATSENHPLVAEVTRSNGGNYSIIVTANGYVQIELHSVCLKDSEVARFERRAKHMIACVNEHDALIAQRDALVKALKGCLPFVKSMMAGYPQCLGKDCPYCITVARADAALRLAGEL